MELNGNRKLKIAIIHPDLGICLRCHYTHENKKIRKGGFDKCLKENVDYLEELEGLSEYRVSDQVNFVTSCSTAERNTLLSECLCVSYTPKDEHLGIVPLEAMAAQKPVIACNSRGPAETIIHEVSGYLCEPTPLDFSKSMAKLMGDPKMA